MAPEQDPAHWLDAVVPIARQSAIYILAIGLARVTPFLLVPVLTRYLTLTAYGEFELWMATLRIVSIFISLGSPLYLITKYYQLDDAGVSQSVRSVLVLGLLSATCLSVLGLIFIPFAAPEIVFSSAAIMALIITGLGRHIVEVAQAILQMVRRAGQYLMLGIVIPTTAFTALFAYLYANNSLDIAGAVLSQVISLSAASAVALFLLHRMRLITLGAVLDLKPILSFGLPLLPHVLALWSMNYVDRYFILRMVGAEELGLYSAAYTLGLGIVLIHEAAQRVWQPGFFERLADPSEPNKIRIVRLTWLGYGASIVTSLLYLLALWVALPILLGDSFLPAFRYLPYIVAGYTFHGMYRLLAGYLYLANSTGTLALITGASAVLNILLNLFLIPSYGTVGAAIATAISFAAMFLGLQGVAALRFPMPWLSFHRYQRRDRIDT